MVIADLDAYDYEYARMVGIFSNIIIKMIIKII